MRSWNRSTFKVDERELQLATLLQAKHANPKLNWTGTAQQRANPANQAVRGKQRLMRSAGG